MSCYHIYLGHCMVETQSARLATDALSSGESEFYDLNMGCAAGILVMSCFKEMQLEHLAATGRPVCQRPHGERSKHMGAKHFWSQESSLKRLVRAECDRHTHEHGGHGYEVLERHNEDADGVDATVVGGHLIVACRLLVLNGEQFEEVVHDWTYVRLPRVSRSGLHCKSQAASAVLDAVEYVKCFQALVRHPNVDPMDNATMHLSGQYLIVICAKSLCDAAQRDGVTSFTAKCTGIGVLSFA